MCVERMNGAAVAVDTARYGTAEDLSLLLTTGIDINQPDEVDYYDNYSYN